MKLTEFVLARIAEDEDIAQEALASASIYDQSSVKWHWIVAHSRGSMWHPTPADPARVLAECEAKRRIVEDLEEYAAEYRAAPSDFAAGRRHAALLAATRVAAVYADHAGCQPEWKP